MSLQKIKTTVDAPLWSDFGRYKVGMNVTHNGNVWINTTGRNSEPGVGSDWLRVGGEDILKEDKANKATDFVVINDVLYPTTKAVKDYIEALKGLELASLDGGGKLLISQLPSIAITSVVTATENTLASFVANSGNYDYQQGDAIVIVTAGGDKETYLFQGGSKTDVNNYAEINNTNLLISDIDGLQSALDSKMNANGLTTNDFIRKTGGVTEHITGFKFFDDGSRIMLGTLGGAEFFHSVNNTYLDLKIGDFIIRDNFTERFRFTKSTGEFKATSLKRTGGTAEQSLMADGSVKVFANILDTSFTLNATQLKNLGTTSVDALPALPANQYYDVLSVSFDYTYGTEPFDLLKRLEVGGFNISNIFLGTGNSGIYKCFIDGSNENLPQKGGALTFSSPDPNSTTGDGSANFFITYRIVTV